MVIDRNYIFQQFYRVSQQILYTSRDTTKTILKLDLPFIIKTRRYSPFHGTLRKGAEWSRKHTWKFVGLTDPSFH